MCFFVTGAFTPAPGLRNPHVQTIVPLLLSRRICVRTVREIFFFPDGDFTELAWTKSPECDTTEPVVILLHGLAGSKNSAYVKTMLATIQQSGWTGVLMHFRGCGDMPNNRLQAYHSGKTDDLRFLVKSIKNRFPKAPVMAVGFSIGGNLLVKYLGEEQSGAEIDAAVAVSAPLDLSDCAQRINSGLSRMYQKYLLAPLKKKLIEKSWRFMDEFPVNIGTLKQIKTLNEFDDKITAPLFGFTSADDYYRRSSGKPFLKQVQRPCLLIHARDDPFMSSACIPGCDEVSRFIKVEASDHGGHLGFVSGSVRSPLFWCNNRIMRFLKKHISGDS